MASVMYLRNIHVESQCFPHRVSGIKIRKQYKRVARPPFQGIMACGLLAVGIEGAGGFLVGDVGEIQLIGCVNLLFVGLLPKRLRLEMV